MAGAVFLPAAGYIGDICDYSGNGTYYYGYYWTSTVYAADATQALCLYMRDPVFEYSANTYRPRQRGFSVRLVHDF